MPDSVGSGGDPFDIIPVPSVTRQRADDKHGDQQGANSKEFLESIRISLGDVDTKKMARSISDSVFIGIQNP